MSVIIPSVFVMVYVESYFGLPYVKCLHFVGLKCSCHFSDHDVCLLMSTCKIYISGVMSKDLKVAINSIWQVVYEEYEENGTKDASLGDTTCHF